LGGIISQLVALRHPDRVRSLVLISSTPGRGERLSPPTDEFMAYVTRAVDPDEDPIDGTVGFCRALAGSRFPFDEPYYRRLATADIARGTNLNSNQGRIPASSSSRIDDLATVGVPTLVVHGTEDPLFPFDHAEALAGAIPGARLVAWDGVGHELPPQLVPELASLVIRHVAAS
jgi:pimeloyl-ACP methyl ester carboxylesterase